MSVEQMSSCRPKQCKQSGRPYVGGLHLPKVLKNTANMFSKYNIYKDLRPWDEAIHDMKNVVREKDEPVPKLHVEKLQLSSEKWNRLKGKRLSSP
jgi:hypothetical protein